MPRDGPRWLMAYTMKRACVRRTPNKMHADTFLDRARAALELGANDLVGELRAVGVGTFRALSAKLDLRCRADGSVVQHVDCPLGGMATYDGQSGSHADSSGIVGSLDFEELEALRMFAAV